MNLFFNRLNSTTKSDVNASFGAAFMSKKAREQFDLFENMAAESQ